MRTAANRACNTSWLDPFATGQFQLDAMPGGLLAALCEFRATEKAIYVASGFLLCR
jgi:hypothetical protein